MVEIATKLTRITWDRMTPGKFMVETGELLKLTPEEEKELVSLRLQLEPYGDFLNLGEVPAEDLEELFKAKARRGELEDKTRERLVWAAKAEDEVESIVLVLQPEMVPTYVENLPAEWIDKIFNSVIIQTLPAGKENDGLDGPISKSPSLIPPVPPPLEEQIKTCLLEIEGTPTFKDATTYLDCVTIEEIEGAHGQPAGHFKVMPRKFLEADWRPINDKLQDVFGQQLSWTSDRKKSHWKVWK